MFERLNDDSRLFLSRWYLSEWQTAEERVREIADNAEKILGIKWFSDKFYDYMSKGYYSLATPVWTNFGNNRWLNISCYCISIWDSVADIMKTSWELWVMSKLWWWVGSYFWNIRPRWSIIKWNWESSGSVFFMELFDKVADCINQWQTRRWFTTPYLPADHWDIEEFLEIGSEWHAIQRCTTWVVIPEWRMESMIEWDKDKRKVWAKMIQARTEKWFPYIMFQDNCHSNMPQVYKDKWMTIDSSNICSEICLNIDENHSFVCCLSSINLLHRDEIKETDAVETMVQFLDANITEFLTKLEKYRDSDNKDDQTTFMYMEKAHNFAKKERALGMWVLWRHHYLQSNMIPFESEEAKEINKEIFKTIKDKAYKTSAELATQYWEPSLLKGYGMRNSTLTAVAPTTSSAFIIGQVSQSIEPLFSNYYIKDLAKHKVVIKNPYLKALLKEKKMDNKDTRDSILDYDGSVQHLEWLTQEEKNVFKTFREIDQQVVIDQAADRQKFIDQSQSLNLMITPTYTPKDVSNLLIDAWKKWVKTLYYQHSVSAAQEFTRKRKIECVWCSW
jgi:ribonucleoside-diphosphate reductase alpha chain